MRVWTVTDGCKQELRSLPVHCTSFHLQASKQEVQAARAELEQLRSQQVWIGCFLLLCVLLSRVQPYSYNLTTEKITQAHAHKQTHRSLTPRLT